jgi:hypothetical protein
VRYTTQSFNEEPYVLGEFSTGATVTIALFDLATGSTVPIDSNAATEIGSTGVFRWATANITTPHTEFTELLYIMTDTTTGRTHKGKLVVGGFPSESAFRRYLNVVTIDVVNGTPLTTPGVFEFPIGTPDTPVNNEADARTIADFLGILSYQLINGSSISIDSNYDGWSFAGKDPDADIITHAAGNSVVGAFYDQVGLRGGISGRISAQSCIVGLASTTTSGLEGILLDVGLAGTVRPAAGGTLNGLRVAARDLIGTTIDFNDVIATVVMGGLQGILTVRKITNVNSVFGAALLGASVTLDSTNTNGIVRVGGIGEFIDNSTAWIVIDETVKGSELQALGPLVERLHGRNVRTRLFYAVSAVAARNVAIGGASHMEVEVKDEDAADWSSPTTFYVVFKYESGALASTPPATAEPAASAPVDGSFTAENY